VVAVSAGVVYVLEFVPTGMEPVPETWNHWYRSEDPVTPTDNVAVCPDGIVTF
jgi:hypothetical protein